MLDTMCLNHFALAERLDVLRDLVIDRECWTTGVVVEELRQGATGHPLLSGTVGLDWINIIQLDTLDEIRCFVKWTRVIGSGRRDLGEASVLAAAELRGAVAITDDREAVRVGRAHGAQVHGTVWLLAGACRDGKLTLVAAENLIEALRSTQLRLPCTGAEFPQYAQQHGLLSVPQNTALSE